MSLAEIERARLKNCSGFGYYDPALCKQLSQEYVYASLLVVPFMPRDHGVSISVRDVVSFVVSAASGCAGLLLAALETPAGLIIAANPTYMAVLCAGGATVSVATGYGWEEFGGGSVAASSKAAKEAGSAAKGASRLDPGDLLTKLEKGKLKAQGYTAICKDGWVSNSKRRTGTCSSHGGVAEWL